MRTYVHCKGGGGDILLMGTSQPVPVNVHCGIDAVIGNVNEDATALATAEFGVTLQNALEATKPPTKLSAENLRRLIERVISNLTVSPAMEVITTFSVLRASRRNLCLGWSTPFQFPTICLTMCQNCRRFLCSIACLQRCTKTSMACWSARKASES